MNHTLSYENRIRLFEHLTEEEYRLISNNTKTKYIPKGVYICKAGDLITSFTYLSNGLIKLHKEDRFGKEQIVSLARPEDYVGLLTVFSNKNYNYSMTTLVDCSIEEVRLDIMHKIIRENGGFALDVMKYISNISDKIIQHTYAINSKNLRGRIALILIDFSDSIFNSDSFDMPISRKEIGELIDMTPENVIRILSELSRDGLINFKGKHVEILNKKMLLKIRDLG